MLCIVRRVAIPTSADITTMRKRCLNRRGVTELRAPRLGRYGLPPCLLAACRFGHGTRSADFSNTPRTPRDVVINLYDLKPRFATVDAGRRSACGEAEFMARYRFFFRLIS